MKLSSNCEQAGSYNINQHHRVVLYHQKGFDHNSNHRCLISYKLVRRLRQKIMGALLVQPASLSLVRDGVWPHSKQCLCPRIVNQGVGNGCCKRFIYLCGTYKVPIESGCRIFSSFYRTRIFSSLATTKSHAKTINNDFHFSFLFFF